MLAFQDLAAALARWWKHAGAANRGETAASTAVAEASDEGKHAVAAVEL